MLPKHGHPVQAGNLENATVCYKEWPVRGNEGLCATLLVCRYRFPARGAGLLGEMTSSRCRAGNPRGASNCTLYQVVRRPPEVAGVLSRAPTGQ